MLYHNLFRNRRICPKKLNVHLFLLGYMLSDEIHILGFISKSCLEILPYMDHEFN